MSLKSIDKRTALRHVLLTLVCYAVFLPVVVPLVVNTPTQVTLVAWVMIAVSVVANFGVLTYHYLTPPHPKFTCIPWRRAVFGLHMLAGTVELAASGVAFYYGGVAWAGNTMALSVCSCICRLRICKRRRFSAPGRSCGPAISFVLDCMVFVLACC